MESPKDVGKAVQLAEVTDSMLNMLAKVEGSVESAAPVSAAAKKDKMKLAELNDTITRGSSLSSLFNLGRLLTAIRPTK